MFFLCITLLSFAQEINKNSTIDSIEVNINKCKNFNYKQLIIPSILVGYGVWATDNDQLEFINFKINQNLTLDIDDKISMDDFSQYAPIIATLGLDLVGVSSKNNFKDKSIITATSYLIMGIVVNSIKNTAHIQRPDGTSLNSFPSGHTATAFMGAELLFQEYKEKSIWYGISGYVVATGTGVFRMYNNRHWLSDIFAGAGIGILSAKAGYWLHPTISKLFTNKKESNTKTSFIPFYNGKLAGFGLVSTF